MGKAGGSFQLSHQIIFQFLRHNHHYGAFMSVLTPYSYQCIGKSHTSVYTEGRPGLALGISVPTEMGERSHSGMHYVPTLAHRWLSEMGGAIALYHKSPIACTVKV